jgi:preprotein translocase subunit SecF
MADEGFTGTEDKPLAAPITERLRAKSDLEREADEAKAADEHTHDRVERRKAEERQAVAQHLAPFGADTPEGWHARREAARSAPLGARAGKSRRRGAFPVMPVVAALAVLVLPRRLRWMVALPVVLALLFRDAPDADR